MWIFDGILANGKRRRKIVHLPPLKFALYLINDDDKIDEKEFWFKTVDGAFSVYFKEMTMAQGNDI